MKKYILLILLLLPLFVNGQTITTIAGQGSLFGDGNQATASNFSNIGYMIFDKWGNLYFSNVSDHKLRKIDTTGIVSTIAGVGGTGLTGDGGPATLAKLNQPAGVAVDTLGNIFFSDNANHRVRKIDAATGIITTVVGSTSGFGGDGNMASDAQLKLPSGLWIDKAGNLFIGDSGNGRVRKVNTAGIIMTVAGTGLPGWGGDGGPATAARCFPWGGICTDALGNLYFGEWSWGVVRKVDMAGVISTVAGDTTSPHYYNGDGMPATNARIDPGYVVVNDGILYLSDTYNHRIRKVTTDGIIHTVAGNGVGSSTGDGGIAAHATVHTPSGLVLDSCGNLYFGQVNTPRIRKIAFNPECWPVGIEEVANTPNETGIYPNPATGIITVKIGKKISNIVITNMLGQVALMRSYDGQQGVDVSALSPGVYVVRVNGVYVQRFMKE